MTEPIDWSDRGAPRSPRFGDTYFSAEDGLAESRAVFLTGCHLPQAWAGRRRFTVAELGFGTGLNLLALLELWRRARPAPDANLHMVSVEAYPMTRQDAARALASWPELAELAAPLLAAWPDRRRGWRRIEWPALGAILDLAIDEVEPALAGWTGAADAWFLDGFAPARNPEMWREAVLGLVAARSSPGARVASFTVAGAVRRGLEAHGFAVERMPGFGRKKQRLEAAWPGAAFHEPAAPRIAVLGAGIAGASLARAFARLGAVAQVFDPVGAGAGASGNPAALVTPRLDAGLGPIATLHAQAYARAVEIYGVETPGAVIARGALQLESTARDGARFDKIASWDGFGDGALGRWDANVTAEALNEAEASGSLLYRDALVVEPVGILSTLLGAVDGRAVEALVREAGGWALIGADGAVLTQVDIAVLSMGPQSARLAPGLHLQSVRGQVSLAGAPFTGLAAGWGGYAIPARTGVLFGATHDRDDTATDVRAADHARNLAALAKGRPALAPTLMEAPLTGRVGIRAATADHLPLAGAVPGMAGVFVLSGLGGRGFTLAPLLAEAVAAQALGLGGPLPRDLIKLVDPARYSRAD